MNVEDRNNRTDDFRLQKRSDRVDKMPEKRILYQMKECKRNGKRCLLRRPRMGGAITHVFDDGTIGYF